MLCIKRLLSMTIKELQGILSEWKVNMEDLYRDVKTIITIGNGQDTEEFVNRCLGRENSFKSGEFVKSLTLSIVNAAQITLIEAGKSFKDIFDDETAVWRQPSVCPFKVCQCYRL